MISRIETWLITISMNMNFKERWQNCTKSKSKLVKVSRLVCPGVRPQSGPVTNFSYCLKFSIDSCEFILWRPLWQEDGSVIYCCCLASPAHSLLGLSPTGLKPYFIVPVFEAPPIWRSRPQYLYIPQGQDGPVTPPGTGFPFRRLLWLAGLRWRYCNTPPQGYNCCKWNIAVTGRNMSKLIWNNVLFFLEIWLYLCETSKRECIVVCRPVASQRLRNKQLYNLRC
jgi:hypothetical protein